MVALALSFGLVLGFGVLWWPGGGGATQPEEATPTAPSTPPSPAGPSTPEDPPVVESPPDDGASGSDAPGTITVSVAPDAPRGTTSDPAMEISIEPTGTGQRICVGPQEWTLADADEWRETGQDGRTVRCRDFEKGHVLIEGDLP